MFFPKGERDVFSYHQKSMKYCFRCKSSEQRKFMLGNDTLCRSLPVSLYLNFEGPGAQQDQKTIQSYVTYKPHSGTKMAHSGILYEYFCHCLLVEYKFVQVERINDKN